ncbi:hypothetical protein [Thiomicrorhabdus sp.]|uniref:hypothetical protein n=1 Tax=Thiomicrorhabdus sp. TaxID=2039724 RepID=UPI0029C6D5A7|nr:hypothetical protein [Thiomicrorhabdus sp.]
MTENRQRLLNIPAQSKYFSNMEARELALYQHLSSIADGQTESTADFNRIEKLLTAFQKWPLLEAYQPEALRK